METGRKKREREKGRRSGRIKRERGWETSRNLGTYIYICRENEREGGRR